MEAQFFKTPSGDEMVIISRAEYEALIEAFSEAEEDAADLAIAIERKADLEAGRDERLPEELSALILRGVGYLTALRKWRGLTQMQLAEKSGVSQGYLSDLESRRRKGAVETLDALAKALDIPRAWLD